MNKGKGLIKDKGLLRLLPDSIFDALVVHESGVILEANKQFFRMFGYKPNELIGRQVASIIIDPESIDFVKKQVHSESQKPYISYGIKKDGSKFPMEIQAKNMEYQGRYVRAGAIRDLSEQKKAEEALRRSEKKYQELADSLPQVIFETDSYGRITYTNRSAFSIFGYTQDDFDGGLSVIQMISPDDRSRSISNIQRVMNGEILGGNEYTALKKDGSTFPVAIYSTPIISENKPIGLRGILVDLTKIKQTEKALHESEEKYRNLVERANDGICIYQDGLIKYVNPRMAKIIGYKVEELMDSQLTDFLIPEEISKVVDGYKNYMKGHDNLPIYETALKHKNGNRIDIELNACTIAYDDKPADLMIIRDITERKKLLAQLKQAQKMETIGTLAGGIAHDFNNILSPIMMLSEMTIRLLPAGSTAQQNLQKIYNAGERARDLVKQILSIARRREENKIPLKISPIVKETVNFLRSTIPSNIDIQSEFKAEQDTVIADPTQINQIVINLCTNATHAMKEKGGILKISLIDEYVLMDDINPFSDLNPGHYLRLTISDTGSGISPDIIDKIFDPYFTTKAPGEGTGLGLAIIHGIVKDYEGEISFESKVGKGTIFNVLLPVIDSSVPTITEHKTELPTGRERILVVEDEKPIIDVVQTMLETLGYKVTARTSSIEALEAFRYKHDSFDLVITDQAMPNMSGKELAKELISIRHDIPIILCTGFSEHIDEKRAKEMGVSAFVMKPIIMGQIAHIIRDVLDK